jgi:hypothetical protein
MRRLISENCDLLAVAVLVITLGIAETPARNFMISDAVWKESGARMKLIRLDRVTDAPPCFR